MTLHRLNDRGVNRTRRCDHNKCKRRARFKLEWVERLFHFAHTKRLYLCRTHKDEFLQSRGLVVIAEQSERIATGHERWCT